MDKNEEVKLDKNTVIVRTDGGICSQIAFAALGKYFEDKGYKVKYDLNWFKNWGKGLDGHFIMNYDMPKAFPGIIFETATDDEIKYYKENCIITGSVPECTAPAYVNGYPKERRSLSIKYADYFRMNFHPVDKEEVVVLEKEMLSVKSCVNENI